MNYSNQAVKVPRNGQRTQKNGIVWVSAKPKTKISKKNQYYNHVFLAKQARKTLLSIFGKGYK